MRDEPRADFHDLHIGDVPFVVVDVETTGGNTKTNRVTEIACIVVRDGAVIEEYTSLVNPRMHIPSNIVRLTGINDAMVWNAPEEKEVFSHVRRLLMQPYAVFVAHNVNFDWGFVNSSLTRSAFSPIEPPRLCTYKLSKRIFPKNKKLNLGALSSYLEVSVKNRHRAYGDAMATAQVLVRLLEIVQEQHNVTTLEDLLSFQNKRLQAFKPPPRSIERLRETLRSVPEEPGVYYFRSANDELLYIGKAKSLKQRVQSYFQTGAQHTPKIAELVKQIRDIDWTTTGTELSALLLESKEIKAHQPRYNTLIKRYKRYPFLRLGDTSKASDDRPQEQWTTNEKMNSSQVAPTLPFTSSQSSTLNSQSFPRLDICFEVGDDGAEYFGPFGSRGAAEAVVDMVNRTFRLRKCTEPLEPDAEFTPCFYHQINRCGAPCAKMQSHEEYTREVEAVRNFLSGEREGVVAVLRRAMHESSEKLEFEDAALRRNQMKELERVFFRQQQISTAVHENNVILAVPTSRKQNKVEVFFIRHGRLQFQRLVGKKLPVRELERSVRDVYGTVSQAPQHCRKEEIDEIRIIAGWVYQHREEGFFLYTANLSPEAICEHLTEMLYDALSGHESREPFED
jgi:DNA polymerase-3 subunit epsilon